MDSAARQIIHHLSHTYSFFSFFFSLIGELAQNAEFLSKKKKNCLKMADAWIDEGNYFLKQFQTEKRNAAMELSHSCFQSLSPTLSFHGSATLSHTLTIPNPHP